MLEAAIAVCVLGAFAWDAWRRWLAQRAASVQSRIEALEKQMDGARSAFTELERDVRKQREQMAGVQMRLR